MALPVMQEQMQAVYDEMKTPHKLGYILSEEGVNIDCATVFRVEDGWRMIYARQDPREPPEKQGYETWMARSDNLLKWEIMGRLLSQKLTGWDGLQVDGGMLLIDPEWGGSLRPEKFNNQYWMSYIGGALPGYEPDPLHIGIAYSESIEKAQEWDRFPEPVLRQDDSDARVFERKTLYKSCVIRDEKRITGHDFIMYYNAKRAPFGIECIGMAVSDDMRAWTRFGACEIMDSGRDDGAWSIAGDPQIVKFNDLWVMHFFVAYHDGVKGTAIDTFACSHDLITWTRWAGTPLIEPSSPLDWKFAHKPFLLKHDGIVYHFYCACGDQGRGLALAVSKHP